MYDAIRWPETSSQAATRVSRSSIGTRLSTPSSLVVAPAGEVVEHGRVVAAVGQMQRGRPPQVTVTAQDEYAHGSAAFRSGCWLSPSSYPEYPLQ